MSKLTRRAALSVATAGLALPWLGRPAGAADTRLRLTWWGGADRSRRTDAVIALYQQRHPGVEVVGEPVGTGYFPRLATQLVGRGGPDIYQIEPLSFPDFTRRGVALPLDEALPDLAARAGIEPSLLDPCRLDGKLFAVPHGLNSMAILYDRNAFAKAGVAAPTDETDWRGYADLSVDLTRAAGRDRYWGSCDASGFSYALQVWLRQRGRDLFGADGKLDFAADDAAEWFAYWADLRRRNGCVPADIATLGQGSTIETMSMVRGSCATSFAYSNQLVGTQAAVPFPLALAMFPRGGAGTKPGQFLRPASSWSINRRSGEPKEAARFVEFFLSDPDAAKILGVERGVPLALKTRELISPSLNDTERATVNYVTAISDKVGPYPPPAPLASQQFSETILKGVADEVAFGRITPAQAGPRLVAEANKVL